MSLDVTVKTPDKAMSRLYHITPYHRALSHLTIFCGSLQNIKLTLDINKADF